jgi:hypothetical protein
MGDLAGRGPVETLAASWIELIHERFITDVHEPDVDMQARRMTVVAAVVFASGLTLIVARAQ